MRISEAEVERIANLSRLKMGEDMAKMQKNLADVLGHFEKLNELDTEDVAPTAHILPVENVYRKDEVVVGIDRDALIANAPQSEDGCYIVPRVVE
jgi:aspartyl-tRNA(Asn)/glutamyl-tRNA(Gln) amidotransferase subunit C